MAEEAVKKRTRTHTPEIIDAEPRQHRRVAVDAVLNPDAELPAVLESDLHEVPMELPEPNPWLELPDGLEFDKWVSAGEAFNALTDRLMRGTEVVARYQDSMLWRLGDVLLYGERMKDANVEGYADKYEQYLDGEHFGYSESSAKNALRTSRVFPPAERRRPPISWSHHVVVAAMRKDQRERWLNRATAEGWSVAQLRQNINNQRPKKETEEPVEQLEIPTCEFTWDELSEASDAMYPVYSLLVDFSNARKKDPDGDLLGTLKGLAVDEEIRKISKEEMKGVRHYDLELFRQWVMEASKALHSLLQGIIELKGKKSEAA